VGLIHFALHIDNLQELNRSIVRAVMSLVVRTCRKMQREANVLVHNMYLVSAGIVLIN
jgi:hypothetical protein